VKPTHCRAASVSRSSVSSITLAIFLALPAKSCSLRGRRRGKFVMLKLPTGLVGVALLGVMATSLPGKAADLPSRHRAIEEPTRRVDGICPCFAYTVRHKVLLSTYGADFDPNNYDFTEPHYFFGGVKTFRRYSHEPVD
jgi:hypothetical protein